MSDEHPAADVTTIVVDPDDVIETMRRNERDHNEQRTHSLRINPSFEGEVLATPHVRQQGNYYPPEMSPKPIHLGAVAFLAGRNHPNKQLPSTCRYPIRHDSRSRFRDEIDAYDEHGEVRELTEEEQAEWDEWWATEIEFWENEVRSHLRDETVLEIRRGDQLIETTIQIRYGSDE